jgi:hypothetical protein
MAFLGCGKASHDLSDLGLPIFGLKEAPAGRHMVGFNQERIVKGEDGNVLDLNRDGALDWVSMKANTGVYTQAARTTRRLLPGAKFNDFCEVRSGHATPLSAI